MILKHNFICQCVIDKRDMLTYCPDVFPVSWPRRLSRFPPCFQYSVLSVLAVHLRKASLASPAITISDGLWRSAGFSASSR